MGKDSKRNTPPTARTLSDLLGTRNTQEQLQKVQAFHRAAITPVFTLVLYFDPRPGGGMDFQVIGPVAPPAVLREMLS